MKQKDIILIVVVVCISAVVSVLVSRWLFTPPKTRQQQVEVVSAISPSFTTPDTKYFNPLSFDPTQLIQIGNNANTSPFNGQKP